MPMCMGVVVSLSQRYFLFMFDDDMRNLIEFIRGPGSQVIPCARLPVIDRLARRNPGWQVQEQVIRQSIDKRLVHPSYLSESLLGTLFVLQPEPHLRERGTSGCHFSTRSNLTSLLSCASVSPSVFPGVCDRNNHCGCDRGQAECLFSLSRSVAGGHRICDGQDNRRRIQVADAHERCGDQTDCFSQIVV